MTAPTQPLAALRPRTSGDWVMNSTARRYRRAGVAQLASIAALAVLVCAAMTVAVVSLQRDVLPLRFAGSLLSLAPMLVAIYRVRSRYEACVAALSVDDRADRDLFRTAPELAWMAQRGEVGEDAARDAARAGVRTEAGMRMVLDGTEPSWVVAYERSQS